MSAAAEARLGLVKVFDLAAKAAAEDRVEEAERLYRLLMKGGPTPEVYRNLAVLLDRHERYDEAEQLLREAHQRWPEDRPTAWFLGIALLARGAWEEGWPLYHQQETRGSWAKRLSYPEWEGGPVKSLLVLPDQGLGDQIQFARFIPVLVGHGVEVTLFCQPRLVRLFSGLGAKVLPAEGSASVPRHEAWTILSALPWRMGVTPETIPGAPYLPGKPGGSGIGVAVRGNPVHTRDRWRSLPPDMAAELFALPGARSLHPEDTGAQDMEDTRRIVEDLERVVTVDTAVAHLAAAMGKPVWLLSPAAADWRWLRGRTDSPWYPTLRIFRQHRPGDWKSALDDVRRALAEDGATA